MHKVVLALHRLEVVPGAEESFNLRLVVIVVDWMDEVRVPLFKLSVVELVRQATMSMAKLSHGSSRLSDFAGYDVEGHVLTVNVLRSVGRVLGHGFRLVRIRLLLQVSTLGYRFDRSSQSAGSSRVVSLLMTLSTLVSLFGLVCFLTGVLVGWHGWVEL